MKIEIAGVTDVGLKRGNNEDALLLWDLSGDRQIDPGNAISLAGQTALLLAVSDGMGGQAAGEVASNLALESLRRYAMRDFASQSKGAGNDIEVWLAQGVEEANLQVLAESQAQPERARMGATLSVAAILGDELGVVHVGDSRIYLLRESRLRQLTVDQTRVQQLVARGHISSEQARKHSERHFLLQAIGISDHVDVDGMVVTMKAGDRLLACSDGLHGLVADNEIGKVLGSSSSPAEQCSRLVVMAKEEGAPDNVTVVVAHVS